MKLLTQEEDSLIRSRLGEMESRLYYNVLVYDDSYWSHKTIKRLLFIIDELQRHREKGDG